MNKSYEKIQKDISKIKIQMKERSKLKSEIKSDLRNEIKSEIKNQIEVNLKSESKTDLESDIIKMKKELIQMRSELQELHKTKKEFKELKEAEFGEKGFKKNARMIHMIIRGWFQPTMTNYYMMVCCKKIEITNDPDLKDFQLFPNLPNITYLYINPFIYVDFNLMPNMKNLETLIASSSENVKNFQFLSKYPKLKKYNGCSILSTFETIPNLDNLEELYLGKYQQSFKGFPSLQNLKKLQLAESNEFTFEFLPLLPNLEELDLREVPKLSFDHFDISKLPKIKSITIHEKLENAPPLEIIKMIKKEPQYQIESKFFKFLKRK